MKKLLLTLLIGSYALAHETDSVVLNNSRNTLITAIARNDFGTTLKALEEITDMTDQEKQQYLQMADQIIFSSLMWFSTHYRQPEIGKDLLKAAAYWIATALSAGTTALSIGLAFNTLENNPNGVPPIQLTLGCTAILAGLTTYLGYKTIQKVIASWMKPSVRLENALRIRDAIFHHINPTIQLPMNTRGSESIACGVGSMALKIDSSPYGTAVGCSHLSYDGPCVGDCGCNCSWCLSAKYNTIGYWSPGASMPEDIEQTKE